jgi:ribonuclease PH
MKGLRKISIVKNYSKYGEGSCLFQMGNTKVLCVATVTENNIPQFCEEKNIGWITAEYSMLPRAGRQRTARKRTISSGRTQEIQRLIGRSLRAAVDLKKLGRRTITVDCDVLQADGGTRTASINGSFIALNEAIRYLLGKKLLEGSPVRDFLGAVSVGIVEDKKLLDLCGEEDNNAQVDMNVVMTGRGKFVEVQATAENKVFSESDLNGLLRIAAGGIREIIKKQKRVLGKI